jgi:hypothetical protein
VQSPNPDGGAYAHIDMVNIADAPTPESSSEDDHDIENTPIYMRSERFREALAEGRYSANSGIDEEFEYDADSILGAYSNERRLSPSPEYTTQSNHTSPSPTDPQRYDSSIYVKRSSLTRRDITPSKIPIFQASPKPIPIEYIFRSAPLHRTPSSHLTEFMDDSYNLKRVRSESLLDNFNPTTPTSARTFPSKHQPKHNTIPRPRSRSMSSVRPQVRLNKFGTPSPAKRPPSAKGEPPWIQHTFTPNPHLPPEEQLVPTVARRLEQERLEREKGLVTVWDREMRPLEGDKRYYPTACQINDCRARESKVRVHKEADDMPTGSIVVNDPGEQKVWPLNLQQKPKPIDPSVV